MAAAIEQPTGGTRDLTLRFNALKPPRDRTRAEPNAELFQLLESCSDGGVGARDTARIVSRYMTVHDRPFGSIDWKIYFGIDAGDTVAFGDDFDSFWNGPDPVDVFKRVPDPRPVSATHLPPILAWRLCTDRTGKVSPRSIRTLSRMGLTLPHVEKDHRYNTSTLVRNLDKVAGPSCWLIMRKGDEGNELSFNEQEQFIFDLNARTGAGYEELPAENDVATVLLVVERVLGNSRDDALPSGVTLLRKC